MENKTKTIYIALTIFVLIASIITVNQIVWSKQSKDKVELEKVFYCGEYGGVSEELLLVSNYCRSFYVDLPPLNYPIKEDIYIPIDELNSTNPEIYKRDGQEFVKE